MDRDFPKTDHMPSLAPLVSVLCRSMNRPELLQALESIQAQTYTNIEVILIDATGAGLDVDETKFELQIRRLTANRQLSRPEAANFALQQSTGIYLLFLDEDDWIASEHLAMLVSCLEEHPEIKVAYCGAQIADQQGNLLDQTVSVDWNPDLLRKDNFIPIHTALFSRALYQAGCRFDESLTIYEDWDFWLQCSTYTDFYHIDHISAFYRMGGSSETQVTDERTRYEQNHPIAQARSRVLDKWRLRWTGADINRLIGAIDQSETINEIHNEVKQAHRLINERDVQLVELASAHDNLQAAHRQLVIHNQILDQAHRDILSEHDNLRAAHRQLVIDNQILDQAHRDILSEHDNLQAAHRQLAIDNQILDQSLRDILSSFSWRAMGPYRRIKRNLVDRIIRPLQHFWVDRGRSPAVADKDTSVIQGGILFPPNDSNICQQDFTMVGWAWASSGLKRIEVFVDGEHYENIPSDYATNQVDIEPPTLQVAQQKAFACRLVSEVVEPGPHKLEIRITDNSGDTLSIVRSLIVNDRVGQYLIWRQRHNLTRSLLEPGQEQVFFIIACFGSVERLELTLRSLIRQVHLYWTCSLLIVESVDATFISEVERLLKTYPESLRSRFSIRSTFFDDPAASVCSGILHEGEVLERDCVSRMLSHRRHSNASLVYTDHDYYDDGGTMCDPWFTPEWSPELLLNQNYIGGFFFAESTRIAEALTRDQIKTPVNCTSAWRFQLLLALTSTGTTRCVDTISCNSKIVRVAEMLWSAPLFDAEHLRENANQELNVLERYAWQGENRRIPDFKVSNLGNAEVRHVVWPLENEPLVSIVIPTTGNPRYLRPCLDTLLERTDYVHLEIILLDNSRGKFPEGIAYAKELNQVKVIECDEKFNWSKLNNKGASVAAGEILLFLNDDIEIIEAGWLRSMVRLVMIEDVGTVGCMLLYPNGAIQHAGVFLVDHGGGARHLFHRQLPGKGIYRNLDSCAREVSASTGACLMITRKHFNLMNCFDENLALVGNDIDLCLRCQQAGLRNLWTPQSKLIHHESVSRKNKPIAGDEKAMWQRWGENFTKGDPYFNPNLSLEHENMSLSSRETGAALDNSNGNKPGDSNADFGVNLIAYIRAEMGVGEASRGNAKSLEAAGIQFGIMNYQKGNPSRMVNLSWQHREITAPQFGINIIHINADHTPSVMAELGGNWFQNRYNIGYWVWELPEFPDRWRDSFNLLDEIWVPSGFVNDAIAAKSPIPVITIPHAIHIDPAAIGLQQKCDFHLPEEAFIFLSMFDIHSIAQRKNPYGSIIAFQNAFSPDNMKVHLAIKINNSDAATIKTLEEFVGNYSNISIIEQHLDRSEINALLSHADCFVSLHHSEGFGLAPAEAMYLGKVAIITNWSGNTQYMDPGRNCIAIDYKLSELELDYGPYEKGQIWAIPDTNQCAEAMQDLIANPERARILGQQAQRTITEHFSPIAIGRQIEKRLQIIQEIRSSRRRLLK